MLFVLRLHNNVLFVSNVETGEKCKSLCNWMQAVLFSPQVHEGRTIFIMTLEGTQPDLGSVLLNSHTDVVPVYPVSTLPVYPVSTVNVCGNLHSFGTNRPYNN